MVEVITTEVSITIGWEHFKHTATKFEDRDIKRTTTEVKHGNLHILVCLVNTVCQSSGSRFVDNTLNIETSNLSGFLGGLTLRVWEVSRNGDDSFRHFLSEVIFSRLLHLLKNHGRNFLRSVLTSIDFNARRIIFTTDHRIRHTGDFLLHLVVVFTHETLDRVDGLLWVGDGLTFGRVTHLTFAAVNECHYRRSRTLTFAVCNDNWFIAFKDWNTRVCCS